MTDANATETPATISRTLRAYVAQWLHDKLVGIVRRANKHGVPCGLGVTMTEPFTAWAYRVEPRGSYHLPETEAAAELMRARLVDACEGCREALDAGAGGCPDHAEAVMLATVTVTGEIPVLDGWTFLGALDWKGEEILVRTAPGQTIPARLYTGKASPTCDHCEVKRGRHTCYIVRNAEGQVRQVGASCLAEYVRSADADRFAGTLLALYGALDTAAGEDSDEMGRYRSGDSRTVLVTWLAMCCAVVREQRGYVSRKLAADKGRTATTSAARVFLSGTDEDKRRMRREVGDVKVTAGDIALAQRAIVWAGAAFPRDAQVSEFEHNLGAVARSGFVDHKTEGTGGYIAEAYKRNLAPAVAKPTPGQAAKHLAAEVGKRTEFDAEVVRIASFESQFGVTYITVLRRLPEGSTGGLTVETPDAGALVTWKSKDTIWVRSAMGSTGEEARGEGQWGPCYTGCRVRVRATVKAHGEYRGTPQTEITRAERVCDGWGYVAEAGSPEASLRDRMIAEGRNLPEAKIKPARKPRAAKPRKGTSVAAIAAPGELSSVPAPWDGPLPGDDEIPF